MGNVRTATEPKENKINEKPRADAKDAAHLAVRVILSSIPGIGGAAKEIFNTVIAPPLAKRQTQWMESIAGKLIELEEKVKGFRIENLSSNENFISNVFYATTIALRSHEEEKLEALCNAVLNTALTPLAEEDLQHMFLNFVDELTPWHLRMLSYFSSHGEESYFSTVDSFLPLRVVHLDGEIIKDFINQIIKDLSVRGLGTNETYLGDSENTFKFSTKFSLRVTNFGKKFLAFITSPIEEL